MKNWGRKILKSLGLAVIAYLAFALFAPSSYSVERSKKIGASPEIIYSQLSNFENWKNWSPRKEKDSSIVYTYEGEGGKVGSQFFWEGNQETSGSGNILMIQLIQNSTVTYDLTFDNRLMNSRGMFEIKEGKHTTEVIWKDDGDIPFLFRPIAVLSDFESQLIPDLERGLELLDSVAELRQREYNNAQSSLRLEDNLMNGYEQILSEQGSIQYNGSLIEKIEGLSSGGSCKTWPIDLAETAIKKIIKD